MTPGFGFASAVARIEAELAAALALTSAPLRADLTTATGAWKGEPVHLTATAWIGPAVRFARFVRVTAPALDIGNLLVLPRPPSAAPIFGADLVAARPDAALVVADLSPVIGEVSANHDARLPEWTAGIFSATPLLVRVAPADASEAAAEVVKMGRALVQSVRAGESATVDEVERAHARYLAAHRRDEKMITMLGHIFGPKWTSDFVDTVLFPAAR